MICVASTWDDPPGSQLFLAFAEYIAIGVLPFWHISPPKRSPINCDSIFSLKPHAILSPAGFWCFHPWEPLATPLLASQQPSISTLSSMENERISNQTCPQQSWWPRACQDPNPLWYDGNDGLSTDFQRRTHCKTHHHITTSQLFLEDFFFSSFSTLLLFLRWLRRNQHTDKKKVK